MTKQRCGARCQVGLHGGRMIKLPIEIRVNKYGIDMNHVHAVAKARADYMIKLSYPEYRRIEDDAQNTWNRIYANTVKDMSVP